MVNDNDPRLLRLLDLADYEHIFVTCTCGRVAEFMPGFLQRRRRLPSTMLVYDLQFRLRYSLCRAVEGFRIVVKDTRNDGFRIGEKAADKVIVRGS